MTTPTASPYLVPTDGSFDLATAPHEPPAADTATDSKAALKAMRDELRELQYLLYAHDHHSVLLVFQAMDAAGKDGTIAAVTRGMNPTGCPVHSFKQPSSLELQHDFLWRTTMRLPQRGEIGIFNRSHYEEVLVVRVHPEYLDYQNLPTSVDRERIWQQRFESIRDHELHLARNGVVIRKFWLNVSKDEQRRRFLSRLDHPEKNWKFSRGDVKERGYWDDYMRAYEEALRETSKPWAPWYAIPADDKSYMRLQVAQVLLDTLRGLDMRFPEVADEDRAHFARLREQLESEG